MHCYIPIVLGEIVGLHCGALRTSGGRTSFRPAGIPILVGNGQHEEVTCRDPVAHISAAANRINSGSVGGGGASNVVFHGAVVDCASSIAGYKHKK